MIISYLFTFVRAYIICFFFRLLYLFSDSLRLFVAYKEAVLVATYLGNSCLLRFAHVSFYIWCCSLMFLFFAELSEQCEFEI